ncbi:uncharacterized protein [Rutidosis leptorrhynchoides]|uniref:uncharacterized protein n=1 Tax=Rutidosis leptorrhynchoides TaxID=125765 RepID=UPI003A9A33B7
MEKLMVAVGPVLLGFRLCSLLLWSSVFSTFEPLCFAVCIGLETNQTESDNVSKQDCKPKMKKRNKRPQSIRTRQSPSSLFKVIWDLRDEQKSDLISMGLESLLDFKIKSLPGKLSFWLVDRFNAENLKLNLGAVELEITKEDVNEILGFPIGDICVTAVQRARIGNGNLIYQFRKLYKKARNNKQTIFLKNVQESIMKNRGGGHNFKLQMLVLIMTILAEGVTDPRPNQKFLPSINNLEDVIKMDWCGYVLECLKRSKDNWDRNSPNCWYKGPLTFLVVWYVSKTSSTSQDSESLKPEIGNWTTEMLFERESEEYNNGGFGNEIIINNILRKKQNLLFSQPALYSDLDEEKTANQPYGIKKVGDNEGKSVSDCINGEEDNENDLNRLDYITIDESDEDILETLEETQNGEQPEWFKECMNKRCFNNDSGTSRPTDNNGDSGAPRPVDKSSNNSVDDVGVWEGYVVGKETKEVLQAVKRRYPTTFDGIKIRMKEILVPALVQFTVFIKGLESSIKTSVDAIKVDHINSLRKDLNEFVDVLGFDLSWARHRLDMVEELKHGNNALLNELAVLDECLSTRKKTLVERTVEIVQAFKKLETAQLEMEKARLEMDEATKARNNKAKQVARMLAEAYDPIL